MTILEREISNAFNDVSTKYTVSYDNIEQIVLEYFKSERCAKKDLADELLLSYIDPTACYVHISTDNVYQIVGTGKMVHNEEWVPSVMYSRFYGDDKTVYTQPITRFNLKFKKLHK